MDGHLCAGAVMMQHNAEFNPTGDLTVKLIKKPPKREPYVVTGTSEKRKARHIHALAKGLI